MRTTLNRVAGFQGPVVAAYRGLQAYRGPQQAGGGAIRWPVNVNIRWSDAPATLVVLLWVATLWLWWVPVATLRFSVPTGDSFARSWSEEASSIALGAVWGDLGVVVLLALQWLLVPALAGILLARIIHRL